MSNTVTTRQLCRHLGVAITRINQDLSAGFLIECAPEPVNKSTREWGLGAFIAAHFYFDLMDQGVTRSAASKIASTVFKFHTYNIDHKACAIVRRNSDSTAIAVACSDVPQISEWGSEDIKSVTTYRLDLAVTAFNNVIKKSSEPWT
jgi:hypothetical protein